MTNQALIIAAGNGSRLSRGESDVPKPLRKVAGLPLIKRIILLAKKGGVNEFVIVVGYKKEEIIAALDQDALGVQITFVENPDWNKPNGLSVLKAKPYLKKDFLLLMADHIFDFKTLQAFRQVNLENKGAILAVDYRIHDVFDSDDATKVSVGANGDIVSIAKSLSSYNAIDTGMFLCSPILFDVLEEEQKQGRFSLSDAIGHLAKVGKMGTYDIGAAFWQDVDTPGSLKFAEKYLYNACRKNTDGFISRYFNRYVSLFMTRLIVNTPISANQMTFVTTFVGILSAVFTARGTYAGVALGAVLFQLTSIMDGVDGELSKLKLTDSKFGQWLDTISDNFTYILYIIAVIFGVYHQGYEHVVAAGTATLFGVCMLLFIMFNYLLRNTNSGSLVELQKDFQKTIGKEGFLTRVFGVLGFMIKRDFFAVVFMFLGLMGNLKAIMWLCLIGSNVAWMVLLNSRLNSSVKSTSEVTSR